MSQKEMEALDREIEEKVNSKKGAPAENSEERIATAPAEPRNDNAETNNDREEVNRVVKRFEMQRRIRMAVWAIVCITAAAALIAAQYVPAVLPWVLKIGAVSFIVAAAIIIDRGLRRWLV